MANSAHVNFLELRAVGKRFGATAALVDCTLSIAQGEFVTLLGPSGCGKTTALRVIAGFLAVDEGEVRLDGEVLSSAHVRVPPEQRNMGMVFQSLAVWPHMRVLENVTLPLRVRRWRRAEMDARCREMLALCRLQGLEHRYPHQLSGGQLQRVALARALAYRPRVLLLDEPLSSLDAALREEVRRELKRIHRAIGTTFVFVTHDQVEAMSLSDRVVVVNDGRIVQVGAPRQIYENPQSDFVARLIGAANILMGEARPADGAASVGSWQVKVNGIDLIARPAVLPEPGMSRLVVIHPEVIRILRPGQPLDAVENQLAGVVRDVIFLGRFQEIIVDVDGITFRAVQVRGTDLGVGARVHVGIPAADIILL